MTDISHSDLRDACQQELLNIGAWWVEHSQDQEHGGFFGELSVDNKPNVTADKGVILNARILWFFSEAALFTGNKKYHMCADRAFRYLLDYFLDKKYGGFYWSLDYKGSPLIDKKQVYAQAFSIYGLSAYYALTKNKEALFEAEACFKLIESHCVDRKNEGYFEAYTRAWGKIEDVRLSEKDLNYPKTMNTHLHIVEAYTNLYKINPNPALGRALAYGILCFDKYIINHETGHLRTFMDDDWNDHSTTLSYGHDIECSWLLWEAVCTLGDEALKARIKTPILKIAQSCLHEAIGEYGEAVDAYDWADDHTHFERVWWVQAEAMVGYLNAYKLTKDKIFWQAIKNIWTFIQNYQLDKTNGEWSWHSSMDEIDGARDYKVGFWKGPYHNGRAMIEVIKMLNNI